MNRGVPSFTKGAVLVIDRLQKALHARNQIDILDRRSVASRFQIARERPLRGHRNVDFRRRRRNERFCSQALKTPDAAMAKATRQTVTPFFVSVRRCMVVSVQANAKAFIFRAPIRFLFCKRLLEFVRDHDVF